jgi:ABC-2 type transport system ATP-binding protein
MATAIQTHKLSKKYGPNRGILDLDLEIQAGEIFGFLGPNGAGKSTTIATLMDFIRPTSGSAEIFGLDTRKDSVAIKQRIGYLSGDLRLYDKMTGRQLLQYLGELQGGVQQSRVDELSRRLDAVLDRPFGELSRGNKQKIGLVQALMHDPDLLVLDEPTSGLDPLIQIEFYNLLHEFKAKGGTVFMSSHVMPEVQRVCDRVGIVRDARLVAVESLETIRKQALRQLEIHFATAPNLAEFQKLKGIKDLRLDGKILHCKIGGSVDELVKTAAKYQVNDIISHEPDLEEVFLTFYGKGQA